MDHSVNETRNAPVFLLTLLCERLAAFSSLPLAAAKGQHAARFSNQSVLRKYIILSTLCRLTASIQQRSTTAKVLSKTQAPGNRQYGGPKSFVSGLPGELWRMVGEEASCSPFESCQHIYVRSLHIMSASLRDQWVSATNKSHLKNLQNCSGASLTR